MVWLAPRAPADSVRPRRLSDVAVRPLNFTVSRPRSAPVPAPPNFSALSGPAQYVNGHSFNIPFGRTISFISPADMPGHHGIRVGVHLNVGKKLRFLSPVFEIHTPGASAPTSVVARLVQVPRELSLGEIEASFAKTTTLSNKSPRRATFSLELSGVDLPDAFVLRSPRVDLFGIPYGIADVSFRYFPERKGVGLCRPAN